MREPSVDVYRDGKEGATVVAIRFPEAFFTSTGAAAAAVESGLQQAAKAIAEEYLRTHRDAVLAAMSPEAIANLAIAHGAAELRQVLGERLPTSVRHDVTVVERQVPKRGWFR